VSDEFTVPLCHDHHRELHACGNERTWWHDMGVDPLPVAKRLWEESHVTDNFAAAGSEGPVATGTPAVTSPEPVTSDLD
jgi:hypothetical protein